MSLSTRIALAAWFVALTMGAAYLLGGHVAGLPLPTADDATLRRAVERRLGDRAMALHVLAIDCECSSRVLARLEARTPRRDIDEDIVLVGDSRASASTRSALEREGFRVEQIEPDTIEAQLGLRVAPVLVVAGADGEVAYLGGHTARKQGARVETDDVIDAVLRRERPEPLPVLGCALTSELRQTIDPWRLR